MPIIDTPPPEVVRRGTAPGAMTTNEANTARTTAASYDAGRAHGTDFCTRCSAGDDRKSSTPSEWADFVRLSAATSAISVERELPLGRRSVRTCQLRGSLVKRRVYEGAARPSR